MTISKDHLYVFFSSFVIFCGGILLGLISNIEKSQFELFFTALSSISTLGLLLAAIYSYVSWKKHMNYGYLYESAKSMYLVMSKCTPLYSRLYLKFHSIYDTETDIDKWDEFFKSPERKAEKEELSSLIHTLNAEMQTLEIINNREDYQECFNSVASYTQFVVTLLKDLELKDSAVEIQKREDHSLYSFMRFKECESQVKNILTSFINNH
ncbi:hypothetical protein [Vibrio coralliilyticus]|uniref:hypothetical protein n=1 Tax=Vibrio coralliilyticus TaxID=190893 RepID=UPI00148D6475|nr:hypothetical protein [Vibrio coralliilyticus]NOH54972.1 hypothetical protein [Vibrio coralliilyticus]NOI31487.1 hypothetical protein [Vibrio coralliilyticus]NOI50907.1 hypothetical protein [Vibrio coralliilyticus]